MQFHSRPLHHFIYIQEWAKKNNAKAQLDLVSFRLEIIANHRAYVLYPQFLQSSGHGISYSPQLNWQTSGFIGWLPYTQKQWNEAVSKLTFKKCMQRLGQRTPSYWQRSDETLKNVIVKADRGSFGNGIRGPYASINPSQILHQLATGEFYEQFIRGDIIKVWFWNTQPICLEIRAIPEVVGDGESTVRELVITTFNLQSSERLAAFEKQENRMLDMLKLLELGWDSVLPTGQSIQVDFLYGSCLYPDGLHRQNQNQLSKIKDSKFANYLAHMGNVFYSLIPDSLNDQVLYVADGVLDKNENCWWLEMNCNPMFPPDAYATMLNNLFEIK